jgi:hypothetical protein
MKRAELALAFIITRKMSDGDGSSRPADEKRERAGDDEMADASRPKVADKGE